MWLVVGIHWNACIFYWILVHHPTPWSSVRGIFIFRRCMVQHLRFFISLDSHMLSLMNHLGSGMYVAPPLPWGSQAYSLCASPVLPRLYSISFIIFGFSYGGSTPSSLGVLGQAWLVFPWGYLERFLSAFRALPGELVPTLSLLGRSFLPVDPKVLSNRSFLYVDTTVANWYYGKFKPQVAHPDHINWVVIS